MNEETNDDELFNVIASKYAQKDMLPASSIARKSQLLEAMRPILTRIPNGNIGTIVEIGCGVGAPAEYLKGHYKRYIGIDQSKNMIEAAKRFNKANPNCEFMTKSIKANDIPHNTADVVLSMGVLHHVADLDTALESIKQIAKKNSYFVASEPQRENVLVQMLRTLRAMVDKNYSSKQKYFSTKEIRELLLRHNISEIYMGYHDYFTPAFAEVIFWPQFIFVPLSYIAIKIDSLLNRYLSLFLKGSSFSIVVIGKINK